MFGVSIFLSPLQAPYEEGTGKKSLILATTRATYLALLEEYFDVTRSEIVENLADVYRELAGEGLEPEILDYLYNFLSSLMTSILRTKMWGNLRREGSRRMHCVAPQ